MCDFTHFVQHQETPDLGSSFLPCYPESMLTASNRITILFHFVSGIHQRYTFVGWDVNLLGYLCGPSPIWRCPHSVLVPEHPM